MQRLPCKICGAEILPATAERNAGLCAQCVKGKRPCIFCGSRVGEPLTDGTYAHLDCLNKSQSGEGSLGWQTPDDIDWPMVQQKLHEKLSSLFVDPPNPCPQCELAFWIDTNGGLNFDVYQILPDGSQVRFGNLVKGWADCMDPFDEAFNSIVENLEEQDGDQYLKTEAQLRDVVRVKCQELERENFGYPSTTQITWRIIDDA